MFSKLPLAVFVFLSSVSCFANADPKVGEATWYHVNQHGAPGACGKMHYDNEYVVAVAFGTFDTFPGATSNPNHNPICGKTLQATFEGKSVRVKVVDRCADCMIPGNIDLSPVAFKVLAKLGKGRLFGVTWDWTDLPADSATNNSTDTPSAPPATDNSTDTTSDPIPAPAQQRQPNLVRRMLRARRLSVSRQAIAEPILRREDDGVVEIRAGAAVSTDSTAKVVVERSNKDKTPRKPFERRFKMADPIRLRKIYDAIQERDAMKQGVKSL